MISSYNSIAQVLVANDLVTFNTNRVLTGCTVLHAEGTPNFKLTKPGYYYVTFNAIVTDADAGNITAQLQNGTTLVPGAIATESVTAATDVRNLSFATIIRVPPSCCAVDNTANLSIINSGIDATYTVANLNITKLC